MARQRVPIPRAQRDGELPLSFAQQRLWLLDQLEPTPWAYNVFVGRRLRGTLRLDALQRALDALLDRHESLRTTFPAVDGRPMQVVGSPARFELTVVDLAARPSADAETEVRRLAAEEARRRFRLTEGPLIRGLLVRLAESDHVLVLTMHHIVTDAWSEAVLLRELAVLYGAFARDESPELPRLAIQYVDFAVWQRQHMAGPTLEAELDHWRHQLDGLLPVLELPTDRPRPVHRSGRGGVIDLELPAPLVAGLREVSRAGRGTLFMTVLAGFQALLARYSGRDDIAVGTAIANRTRRETEGLIGFFANTLVLRTDLSGDPTFLELLSRVRGVALDAYGHQDLPFEQLVKALRPERSLSHTALFQHMFVYQNTPAADLDLHGLTATPFPLEPDTAMFDLTMTLSETGNSVTGTMEYATDLYDRSTAERMARHFRNLLEGAAARPDGPVRSLEVMSQSERRQVLVEWNATDCPLPERCIHELFEEQVAAHPDAVAVSEGRRSLTYRALNERANAVAVRLRRHGVGADVAVGVCLHRSAASVVAVLAVLKAGGAYLPLDPLYPPARLKFMVEDGGAHVVVTEPEHLERLREAVPEAILLDVADDGDGADTEAPAGNVPSDTTPDSLAYVVYTSGSRGQPKGVMVEHRAVVARLFGVDYIAFDQIGALLHMAPLAFDASTFEIWGALLHGRRCVVSPDRTFSLGAFADVMRDEQVDTLWLTSALFNVVIDEDWKVLHGVRQMIVGGEALSPAHVAKALDLLPGLRLVNGYGPTETTTFAACHQIREGGSGATVPIGRPIANTELYILDPDRRPVPVGATGELHIGGAGLARGYLGRPDLTAERFVDHPFRTDPGARLYRTGDRARYRPDGTVEYLGRLDDQLKIRGFRVEPGEVEAALQGHATVADVAVVARQDGGGSRRLVAYVVPAPGAVPSATELRDHLRSRLPDYLVPSAFVAIAALPLSPNGKVDRAGLAARRGRSPVEHAYVAPTTSMHRMLVKIWAEVLGVEQVGLDDNFFSLGGDSLLAAVLAAKTARRTGRILPLPVLFGSPTVRKLAEALERDDGAEESTVVALRTTGSKRPLFLAHGVSGLLLRYMQLVQRLDADLPVYGLRPTAGFVGKRRRLRIEDLASRYVDDLLAVQPDGPYRLAGFCFGGVIVLEVAHQLERLGHTVELLALFDAEPPTSQRASRARRELAQLASIARSEESAAGFLRRRFTNVGTKVRRLPWAADHWLHVHTGRQLSERWDDIERVEAMHAFPLMRVLHRALGSYTAPETTCTVTLFRHGDPTRKATEMRPVDDVGGATQEWVLDGPDLTHGSLLEEPHVGALARTLAQLLDRRDDAASTSGDV